MTVAPQCAWSTWRTQSRSLSCNTRIAKRIGSSIDSVGLNEQLRRLAPISLILGDENQLCLWISHIAVSVTTLYRNVTETNRFQHHGKLVLIVPPQSMRAQLRMHQTSLLEDLMTHPDVLYLLDTVGHGSLVDEDGGAVGGAHPRTP